MKIGIVFTLNDPLNVEKIEETLLLIEKLQSFKFCFVKNYLNTTCEVLNSLRFNNDEISILDIKKKTEDTKAIKAGARFLMSIPQVTRIGYVVLKFEKNAILKALTIILNNEKDIFKKSLGGFKNNFNSKTSYEMLFPIDDFKSKPQKKFNTSNTLSKV